LVPRNTLVQMERVLHYAARFLEDMREDVERAAAEGADTPPRVRSVHEIQGHATPDFRTIAIPVTNHEAPVSPEVLSGTIARYAQMKKPDCLMLALEAQMEREDGTSGPVLIAEARDRVGTRLFWMQPYDVDERRVRWGEPRSGGWIDPARTR
jgi:hypothetical protein